MGWNTGARADTLERLEARLDAIGTERAGAGRRLEPRRPLRARAGARTLPTRCARWSRSARPSRGDPQQNNVWRLYEWVAGHKVDEPPIPRITDKPPVPHLAIWSRRDGIVAPRAARGLDA